MKTRWSSRTSAVTARERIIWCFIKFLVLCYYEFIMIFIVVGWLQWRQGFKSLLGLVEGWGLADRRSLIFFFLLFFCTKGVFLALWRNFCICEERLCVGGCGVSWTPSNWILFANTRQLGLANLLWFYGLRFGWRQGLSSGWRKISCSLAQLLDLRRANLCCWRMWLLVDIIKLNSVC